MAESHKNKSNNFWKQQPKRLTKKTNDLVESIKFSPPLDPNDRLDWGVDLETLVEHPEPVWVDTTPVKTPEELAKEKLTAELKDWPWNGKEDPRLVTVVWIFISSIT
jgi:hypothetical protein